MEYLFLLLAADEKQLFKKFKNKETSSALRFDVMLKV